MITMALNLLNVAKSFYELVQNISPSGNENINEDEKQLANKLFDHLKKIAAKYEYNLSTSSLINNINDTDEMSIDDIDDEQHDEQPCCLKSLASDDDYDDDQHLNGD